jgi:hypothetical protein
MSLFLLLVHLLRLFLVIGLLSCFCNGFEKLLHGVLQELYLKMDQQNFEPS